MKRNKMLALAAGAISVACSGADQVDELNTSVTESLNGALTNGGVLTRKSRVFAATVTETGRRADTDQYYNNTGVLPNGASSCPSDPVLQQAYGCTWPSSGFTIRGKIDTLAKFRSFYGFNSSTEKITFYYNRGDLGIGREMHCVDKMTTANNTTSNNGQVACYVRNFAAGDDNSEFTFGMSASNAYRNMANNNEFATVAMVYRDAAPANQKVFFAVYGADPATNGLGNGARLQNFAALDRQGLHGALNCFPDSTNPKCNPVATVGVNFNNHIPSNCLACHGGNYATSNRTVTNALFLPFDLDQFEYQDSPAARTRTGQLANFRTLNEMVRKVAARAGSHGNNVRAQLDGWYGNTPSGDPRLERFEGNFNSGFIPAGWNTSSEAQAAYTNVVRPYCRGCHVSSISTRTELSFNTEALFRQVAPVSAAFITLYDMPHALQTVREFWTSPAPFALDRYLRNIEPTNTALINAANSLRNNNRANVVALDPHLAAVSSPL